MDRTTRNPQVICRFGKPQNHGQWINWTLYFPPLHLPLDEKSVPHTEKPLLQHLTHPHPRHSTLKHRPTSARFHRRNPKHPSISDSRPLKLKPSHAGDYIQNPQSLISRRHHVSPIAHDRSQSITNHQYGPSPHKPNCNPADLTPKLEPRNQLLDLGVADEPTTHTQRSRRNHH
ncbi:hypothetical protein L6452_40886 [Arctium lappa]|uniref:Uncharacterized protein n=1 Tax=Arctium lappa TaxID=4217 RepID=A0ACB8XP52_ARCLA|nr:hypothetical protein L6452_40886 [Arctium lappa]